MRFTEDVLEGNKGGVGRLREALEHIAYLEKLKLLEDLKIPTPKLGSALADSSSSDAGKPRSIAVRHGFSCYLSCLILAMVSMRRVSYRKAKTLAFQ